MNDTVLIGSDMKDSVLTITANNEIIYRVDGKRHKITFDSTVYRLYEECFDHDKRPYWCASWSVLKDPHSQVEKELEALIQLIYNLKMSA